MKKSEIKVGGKYIAKVSGKLTTVRVDDIRTQYGWGSKKDCTVYDVTNLTTKRQTTFRSAAKFRGEAAKKTPEVEQRAGPTPAPVPRNPHGASNAVSKN